MGGSTLLLPLSRGKTNLSTYFVTFQHIEVTTAQIYFTKCVIIILHSLIFLSHGILNGTKQGTQHSEL